MNIEPNLITCIDDEKSESLDSIGFFSLQNPSSIWCTETLVYTDFLEKQVFQLARKPESLITHLRRIYYCFNKDLNEQLFAALVDFLIILNRRGQDLSWRIIMGAKSRLDPDQFNLLSNYLNGKADVNLLPSNRYSIFTRGLLGINNMIQQIEKHEERGYDPLVLARDHIEYSQLKEAKQVLENAILDQPNRLDLHHELLTLYRKTNDSQGFDRMLTKLTQSGLSMTGEWTQLTNYFKGRNNDG